MSLFVDEAEFVALAGGTPFEVAADAVAARFKECYTNLAEAHPFFFDEDHPVPLVIGRRP